jgi:hypothetical protein
MPTAAHRERQSVLAGEVHAGDDVRSPRAPNRHRRAARMHRVEDIPLVLLTGIRGLEHGATDVGAKLLQRRLRHARARPIECCDVAHRRSFLRWDCDTTEADGVFAGVAVPGGRELLDLRGQARPETANTAEPIITAARSVR